MVELVIGQCQNCVRHNPKGVSNCIINKDVAYLTNKHSIKILVLDCPHFAPPEIVFPEPEVKEETPKPKSRKKKKAE